MPHREPRHLDQLEVVKSFSHPLRLRLYYALAVRESANSTVLAKEVDTTPQLAFYHLTRLAELGLIEEDVDRPTVGRERLWRLASQGVVVDADDFDAGSAPDLQAMHHTQASVHSHLLEQFFAVAAKKPDDVFTRAAFGSDMPMQLTAEEMGALNDELTEVMVRFRDRGKDVDDGRTRRPVITMLHCVPLEP